MSEAVEKGANGSTVENEGRIVKALSGFYYVRAGDETIECRARGLFRLEGVSPLVGDRVRFKRSEKGKGVITELLERRNALKRPSVANIDLLVIVAAAVIPVTDSYLIDRVSVIAVHNDCDVVICVNKSDLNRGEYFDDIYGKTGFKLIHTSAVTGEGIAELREAVNGKMSAFTGNSGVGKSSILNAFDPAFAIEVGEVSVKLGRGRHTTRHVELFALGGETYIADTPGFASFDVEQMEGLHKDEMQYCFPEFEPFLLTCRFNDCVHLKEPGCSILDAVRDGAISPSRHSSYARLYELAAQVQDWERKK